MIVFRSQPNSAINLKVVIVLFLAFLSKNTLAQTISFGSTGLVNENVLNPTSLEFGPDDRLYVAQQNGIVWAYTIERDNAVAGDGTYTVIESEEITNIRFGIPNHDDEGNFNPSQQRLITGILTAGTAENPILYVASSDFLLGGGAGGNDTNLDTNSSMISKLEKIDGVWEKTDLIRGLPRCEENHAVNGLDMFERNGSTYLLIVQGGQTNKGAPSNNFAGTPEFFFSGSMLIVNLTDLESMPTYIDPRNGSKYVYDLPTLNDPTRLDIDKNHPEFPYPEGHPMREATIDIGDPFGGNNSLNQAFPEANGPVQIFSPGFRNAYDVVIAENGKIYTADNGANALWGGLPRIYDSATDTFLGDESNMVYDPNNHYITNELNENGSTIIHDPLHYVGTINDTNETYYGGHPIPILAFPSRAGIFTYEKVGGSWVATNTYDLETLIIGTSGYFNTSFTMADFPDRPELGEFLADEPIASPRNNILARVSSSTNGITEYTATNFSGAMQGNILTASFNGNINRYELNEAGDLVTFEEATFNGFGSLPLDVTALGDDAIFPGTVWAATYGSNSITIFEPTDINCLLPGDEGYSEEADNDGDGYSNQDEADNNTNLCSQSSKPKDHDGDFISDLNDPDDDNDGILDVNDAFALDPDNGMTTNLPIEYPFWNNDPGFGFFGLGFTGLMLDPSGTTDYLTQFNENGVSFGGAAGKATVDNVTGGDAFGGLNDQDFGFQFGVNVDSNSNPFTVHTKIESPFFGSNGSQNAPVDYQSYGIQVGTGDQDNYLKLVFMNGSINADALNGLQVILEDNGIVSVNESYDIPNILNSSAINLYISIDPVSNTAQPFYSIDDGETLNLLGSPIVLPLSFLDDSDNKGLAVGMISTSRSDTSPNPFTATWDYIEVYENLDGVLSINPGPLDFGLTPVNNSQRTKYVTLNNEGGPTDSSITVTTLNFLGTDSGLFSSDMELPFTLSPGASMKVPIDFSSDQILGNKSGVLEVTHSGSNSPTTGILIGELTDIYSPVVRINSGGVMVPSSDGGPEWEDNTSDTGNSYVVTSGGPFTIEEIIYEDRDISIPDYISQAEYEEVMRSELSTSDLDFPITYSISIPNGSYIVNLYFANLYNGTSEPEERIFDVNIDGQRVIDDLDPSKEFGHRIAGMVQNNVEVTDGVMDISLLFDFQNPIINAIEILGITYPPLNLMPIADRSDCELILSDFQAEGSGGNPADNLVYAISGQPLGIDIEPTNGLIFGTIDETAVNGGPNSDGIYQVTVTLSKPGSLDVTRDFTWTVIDDVEAPVITCPDNITEAVSLGTTETPLVISEPSTTDNCANAITVVGTRSDGLELTDAFPLDDTTITWTATDASGNISDSCEQVVTVEIPEYTLQLNVTLQGRSDYSGNYEVELYSLDDLVTPLHVFNVSANEFGEITLPSSISQGEYKLLVKHPMYLKRVKTINLADNSIETFADALLAGDVNNDNVINIFDLGIFSGTYNLNSTDAGFDARADFDMNLIINIFDLGLFSGNYQLSGDTQND